MTSKEKVLWLREQHSNTSRKSLMVSYLEVSVYDIVAMAECYTVQYLMYAVTSVQCRD